MASEPDASAERHILHAFMARIIDSSTCNVPRDSASNLSLQLAILAAKIEANPESDFGPGTK